MKKLESKKSETETKKEKTQSKEKKTENNASRVNNSPQALKKEVCKFFLQDRCIFGYRCRNIHPPDKKDSNLNIPTNNPNVYSNFNSSLRQNDWTVVDSGYKKRTGNQTLRTETYSRGRQVGYWSLPQHPIPLHQTRFTYLPQVNLNNVNEFPNLSPSH